MRDKPDQELPLREVLLGDARTPLDAQEEAKQKVKELAELWLDEHPWARRAADSYRKEVEARTAAERCKKTSKVGRFSSLLASGGALPTDLQLAPGYGRCAPSFTEQSAESSSPSRLRRLQKAAKTAPVIQESLRAKMMALIVASVESEADVDLLKQCLESICAQTTAPRALWVCWYADSKLRFLVRELLEEIMPRCIRKGTPLTQLQMEEPVGQWRHVEAVLRARQKMGGDVCDMWVALAQAHEVWHPERCRRLCEEASQASNCVPALLVSGLEETSTPEERWSSSSVLMRLPVLCKFLASLPPAMLGHRLCDLAFCSYAWSEPAALNLRNLTLPSVALPHRAPAQRIVQAALEESLMEELSMEEKQAAFGMRRSAGRWAEVISAKDFLRFFICAHLAAEGLQLMQLFGSKVTSVDAEVWKRISEAFEVGDDGFQWLQRQAPEFSKQAKLALGELQEPDEKLTLLLRSNKPSHSRGPPPENTQPT